MKFVFEIDLSFWQDPNFVPMLAKIGVGVVFIYFFILFCAFAVELQKKQAQQEREQELREQGKL